LKYGANQIWRLDPNLSLSEDGLIVEGVDFVNRALSEVVLYAIKTKFRMCMKWSKLSTKMFFRKRAIGRLK
jgi:hypothetical protein